jgi:hypothetical protein
VKVLFGGVFITLALAAGPVWAQALEISDAVVTDKTSVTDPAKAVQAAEGQWLAFSIPVLEGTHSPCCWKGNWTNVTGESGCSLGKKHQSYGTRSNSPTTENVIVLSEITNSRVQEVRVVGESCPIQGQGAKVTWLGNVDEKSGLDWLASEARSDDSTLYALGLHRSDATNDYLYQMAIEKDGEVSEEAIFWLGEARGESGLKELTRLLKELPSGDTRRHINFAVSQNDADGAADLLQKTSESDRDSEQRSDALFWLAQEYPQRAESILLDVINNEQNEDVLEQAVFAISQLPEDRSSKILMDLATDSQSPREVRRQAIFWLANSDDDKAVAALADLLSR